MSEDPSGFAGGDANLYRYAGNSPVMYVDPSGLSYEGVSGPVGDAIRDFLDNELVTAAMELGISLMPGFGEFMDLGIACDSHYSPLERGIAGISFAIGVATLGTSPNVAPFLRATRGLGRMLNRADDVVDVARGLSRAASRGDDVATGVARAAGRGADDVATGLAKTSRRTAVDRVRRFLADESGTLRIPGGSRPTTVAQPTRAYKPGTRIPDKQLLRKNTNTSHTTDLTEWRRTISRNDIVTERVKFVGEDAVKIDAGTWRSLDGKRQFRTVPNDYLGKHGIGQPKVPDTPHVHFEFLAPPNPGGSNPRVLKNVHVPLVD